MSMTATCAMTMCVIMACSTTRGDDARSAPDRARQTPATEQGGAEGGAIELCRDVRLQAARDVTLDEVARVDAGEHASRIAAVIVVNAEDLSDGEEAVDAETVRTALTRAGEHVGTLRVRGAARRIEVAKSEPPTARADNAETSREKPDRTAREPIDSPMRIVSLEGPATVRGRVVERLAGLYGVDPSQIRVAFDEKDEDVLGLAVGDNRVHVQETAGASSARVALRVHVFEGDELTTQRTVAVKVEVLRRVVKARRDVDRGEAIADSMVEELDEWLAPGMGGEDGANRAAVETTIGAVAATRLRAGQILMGDDVEQPVVIKRGELVTVHWANGGIHVRTRARAEREGRVGEVIPMRIDRGSKRFMARVGRGGQAVVVADELNTD